MLLPTSETAVLVALVLSLVGWGSWACFYKAAKKSRFEFFAYDFALGAVIAALIGAFVLGMWDTQELTFQDNFALAGLRRMAWVISSGLVFALANLMLLAGVATSGMSVAFPITFGLALAISSVAEYFLQPNLNATLSFGGAAALLVGAAMAMIAYSWFLQGEEEKALMALREDPRGKTPPKKRSGAKAYALSAIAGILFSVFFYALGEGTTGGDAVASYGAALLLSGALFGATIVIAPFFLNFPVKGKPLTVRTYVRVEMGHHLLGVLGGILWTAGLLGGLVTIGLPVEIQPSPLVTYLLMHGAPLFAAAWGLLIWREMRGGTVRVHAMMGAMFVLLAAGMGLVAISPGR